MTNHELEAVNQLAYFVLIFGFFTGIFFSRKLFDIIEYFIERNKIRRRFKRWKLNNKLPKQNI